MEKTKNQLLQELRDKVAYLVSKLGYEFTLSDHPHDAVLLTSPDGLWAVVGEYVDTEDFGWVYQGLSAETMLTLLRNADNNPLEA